MTWVELAAAILSAWAVWLTARRRPWCWPLGLVSVGVYAWVFVHSKLYSDALLQGAFALMLGYGWWRWLHNLQDDGRVRIAPLAPLPATAHVGAGALAALLLGAFMHHHTDASLPWLDATLAAFSLVAQGWQAGRHVAAWWMWILVDVVYVGMYLYKGLYITAVLYAAFLVLAIDGLRSWRRARADAAVAQA